MKKKQRNNAWLQVGLIVVFIIGIVIALYPFYVGALNNFIDQYRIGKISKENNAANQAQLKALQEKNKQQSQNAVSDPFKNASESTKINLKQHLIGSVIIPKIKVDLPLFDTTNSKTIQYGAAVLDGTSFPVGGVGTHSVVSSHRGLPERKLFTDLNKLKKGDIFIFEVYNQKIAYEIESIKTVLPTDTSVLAAEPGRDIASLLTCTPYMLNTHRLVLKGHRVPYTAEMDQQIKDTERDIMVKQALILTGCVLLFGGLLYVLVKTIRAAILRKKRFDLTFYCVSATGEPLAGIKFGLYDKNGKKNLLRAQKPYIVASDALGKVSFTDLPGALYSVRRLNDPRSQRMLAGIKQKKQTSGALYPRKKQAHFVIYRNGSFKWRQQ